jgi:hypothetical protein
MKSEVFFVFIKLLLARAQNQRPIVKYFIHIYIYIFEILGPLIDFKFNFEICDDRQRSFENNGKKSVFQKKKVSPITPFDGVFS